MNKIKTCCMIDDDPIFIYGTKRIMQEVGFSEEIIVFNDGEEALEGLQKISDQGNKLPEVIFLDINMPIMNGWEFLDEVIKLPTNNFEKTLIYIMSSSVDPRDLEKVKKYNIVSNYILKPITPHDLEDVLRLISA